jgi:hypothetical protein
MVDDGPQSQQPQPGVYPGYQPPPGGFYPPPPGQYPPPQKKRKVWPWVLGGVIGVFILLFGGCVAILASVGDSLKSDTPTVNSNSGSNRPEAERGPAFPGKQPKDTAANAGDSVTVDGLTTTASPLFERSQFSSEYLCTTVTVKNDSEKPQSFNTLDWKLQDPSATARMSSFMGTDNPLSSGEVAAGGGTAVGDICFDSSQGSPTGTYVVLFDPTFSFSSDRVAWINQR